MADLGRGSLTAAGARETGLPATPAGGRDTAGGNVDQLATPAGRREALEAACRATRSLRPSNTLEDLLRHPVLLSKMIYDDDYRLIYCYVPKVRGLVRSLVWSTAMGGMSCVPDICAISSSKVFVRTAT